MEKDRLTFRAGSFSNTTMSFWKLCGTQLPARDGFTLQWIFFGPPIYLDFRASNWRYLAYSFLSPWVVKHIFFLSFFPLLLSEGCFIRRRFKRFWWHKKPSDFKSSLIYSKLSVFENCLWMLSSLCKTCKEKKDSCHCCLVCAFRLVSSSPKFIIGKSRGEVSLMEQDTIENVS